MNSLNINWSFCYLWSLALLPRAKIFGSQRERDSTFVLCTAEGASSLKLVVLLEMRYWWELGSKALPAEAGCSGLH